jgi:hypothetical protein
LVSGFDIGGELTGASDQNGTWSTSLSPANAFSS